MDYLIGDLQGCHEPLDRLLARLEFSPSRDRVCFVGDLVNRGPGSLATLKRLRKLEGAVTCILGNHDLHLLAVAHGIRRPHRSDTLTPILEHRDRKGWLDWVRQQPLAVQFSGWLCVHAGVAPTWTEARTLELADEVHQLLAGPDWVDFLRVMYGNNPDRWSDDLRGPDRHRCIVNVLTRMRFIEMRTGRLEMETKGGPDKAPPGCAPWFDVPERASADTPIAFGHWSTLGLVVRPRLLSLDTGCVWGGQLTAVRVDGGRQDVTQVECEDTRVAG